MYLQYADRKTGSPLTRFLSWLWNSRNYIQNVFRFTPKVVRYLRIIIKIKKFCSLIPDHRFTLFYCESSRLMTETGRRTFIVVIRLPIFPHVDNRKERDLFDICHCSMTINNGYGWQWTWFSDTHRVWATSNKSPCTYYNIPRLKYIFYSTFTPLGFYFIDQFYPGFIYEPVWMACRTYI